MKPKITVHDYITLISGFIDKRIAIEQIEEEYNQLFYGDQDSYLEAIFLILDKLFADIECYDPECLPGQESAFVVSAEELYRLAQVALNELKTAI